MTLELRIDEGIAEVTLNRPDKRNAVNLEMFRALIEAQEELGRTGDLRGVVLQGAGKAFCAGIDLSTLQQGKSAIEALLAEHEDSGATVAQQVAVGWRSLPVPVVAALHGTVFGAGLQIALGADIRIAAPDTQLSVMEVRWGILPDMGITATARHLLRMDVLLDLAFSGRVVGAEEAQALGLVTRVEDDPGSAAKAWTSALRDRSPDALAAMKKLFYGSWVGDAKAGWRAEANLQRQLLGRPNQLEAIQAGLQQRKPRFTTE